MKIRGSTICFKSTPFFYEKEKSGIKNNTIQKLDCIEEAYIRSYNRFKQILIENTDTHEIFVREISDISYYDGFFIFTWKTSSKKEVKK